MDQQATNPVMLTWQRNNEKESSRPQHQHERAHEPATVPIASRVLVTADVDLKEVAAAAAGKCRAEGAIGAWVI